MRFLYNVFSLTLLALLGSTLGKSQGTSTQVYGKNVVQYKEFTWNFIETRFFTVYFNNGGKELGKYVADYGQNLIKDIEKKLEYPLSNKVVFIVYNTYDDFRQSNFRVEDVDNNLGQKTRVLDNKIFIYFNGNHTDFQNQIQSAIAVHLLNEMLYGGSLQERVQNDILLNLPEWYSLGLINHLTEGWNPEKEARFRDAILNDKLNKFRKLTPEQQAFVGEALWRYLSYKYGNASIANVLYITRSNKSIESGFLFVVGKTYLDFYDEFLAFYKNIYSNIVKIEKPETNDDKNNLPVKNLIRKGEIVSWDLSADKKFFAYASNDEGRIRIHVKNLETNRTKKILYYSYRRNDKDFDNTSPILKFYPNKNTLGYFYQTSEFPVYREYDTETEKKTDKKLIDRLERVLSMNFSDDGKKMVVSGIRLGQSDIYSFNLRTYGVRNVTNDAYDDLDAIYGADNNTIFFTSNRIKQATSSPLDPRSPLTLSNAYAIFSTTEGRGKQDIHQVSAKNLDAKRPKAFDTNFIAYISGESGVYNLNIGKFDSFFFTTRVVVKYKDTTQNPNDTLWYPYQDRTKIPKSTQVFKNPNFYRADTSTIYQDSQYIYSLFDTKTGILDYKFNHKKKELITLEIKEGKYQFLVYDIPKPDYQKTLPRLNLMPQPKTTLKRIEDIVIDEKEIFRNKIIIEDETELSEKLKSDSLLKNPYFQSELYYLLTDSARDDYDNNQDTLVNNPQPDANNLEEEQTEEEPTDEPGDDLINDEELLRNALKRKKRKDPVRANLYQLTFRKDFFTSHLDNSILNSPYFPFDGTNTPINTSALNGMMKLGTSDLFKDYRVVGGFRFQTTLTGGEYFINFDNFKSRLNKQTLLFRRSERTTEDFVTTRTSSHEARKTYTYPFTETHAIRLSVFGRLDNTTVLSTEPVTLNAENTNILWMGSKLEFVIDNSREYTLNILSGTKAKWYTEYYNAINRTNTALITFGQDIRVYKKIHRELIWANRWAAAISTGTARLVYYMGGVDNLLNPEFNETNPVDPSQNFAYRTLATNMRGFAQNARNGNAYTAFNSELRFPLVRYFSKTPVNNQVVNNFQIVGFVDVGTAWNGFSPFSDDNLFDTKIIEQGAIKATVLTPRQPVLVGTGFGFRTSLFGYFVRLDYGYGFNEGPQPRVMHLSLGTDF